MKLKTVILSFITVLSLNAQSKPVNNFTVHENFNSKTEVLDFGNQLQDPAVQEFLKLQTKINFFLAHPGATFLHTVTSRSGSGSGSGSGSVIYRKHYTTDKLVRFTPQKNNQIKKEHLIIAGDSNIFGIGSNDEETISAQLANNFPTKKIYNLGISGAGPNTLLNLLEKLTFSSAFGVWENKGTMIYDFNFYLIERITGSVHCIEWCKIFPFYQIDENQKLITKGSIEDHWSGQLYQLMKAIPFSETFFPNFPQITNEHLKLTVKILEAIKTKYLKQTDIHNEFIVSINPNNLSTDPKIFNEFIRLLKSRKIKVITFPGTTLNYYNEDGHVSPAGHKIYADAFRDKLNLAN